MGGKVGEKGTSSRMGEADMAVREEKKARIDVVDKGKSKTEEMPNFLDCDWLQRKFKELNLPIDDDDENIEYGGSLVPPRSRVVSDDHDDDDSDDHDDCVGLDDDDDDDEFENPDVKYWVEHIGLCTPMLQVQVKGKPLFAVDFVDNKPLPQDIYDYVTRGSFTPPKEVKDGLIRGQLLGTVARGYEELPLATQTALAKIALETHSMDAQYEFVRCIQIFGRSMPTIGIHMVFVARRHDNIGSLFSVHLDTAVDPPVVRAFRLISDIDAESLNEGEPRYANLIVPLDPKGIACRVCALGFKWIKSQVTSN